MVIKLSSMLSKKTFALPKKRLWIHYTRELQSVFGACSLTRGVPQIGTPVTHDHSGVAARIAGKKASQTTSLGASNLLTHLGEMLNHPICRDNSRGRERARESRPIFKSSKRRIAQSRGRRVLYVQPAQRDPRPDLSNLVADYPALGWQDRSG